jgi:hypothetical protein
VKGLVIGGKLACNKYIIAATAVAFFLIMMMTSYSVLAYTEHGGGDKPSSDTMFFRVLKGDLNVCSPNYQYNITICQMVMKDEELSPNAGEVTNSTHTNNATNTTNSTNSSSYPPLSVNPEMVINEEQLQALLTNSSLNPHEGAENGIQNDTGTSPNNNTQSKGVGKIYVDEYPQYEPLVARQPLEEEITTDNSLQTPWQSNQQWQFMNNQTVLNGLHDIEQPAQPKNTIRQQDNHQESVLTKEGSSLGNSIDNRKADTSNSYSSIPLGMSLPLRN